MLKQISLYLMVGGSAALLNFGSRFLYSLIAPFNVSVVLAYVTGLFYNYTLSRRYVFEGARNKKKRQQFPVFAAVAVLGLLLTLAGSLVAVWALSNFSPFVGINSQQALAHIVGIGCGFVGNFLGHRYITFRPGSLSPE